MGYYGAVNFFGAFSKPEKYLLSYPYYPFASLILIKFALHLNTFYDKDRKHRSQHLHRNDT
jgi:hypothetical protein